MAMPSNDSSPRIVYVMQFFPYLTETFVYREVLALREAGLTIMTVAIRPTEPAQRPPDAEGLAQTTRYIFPLNPRKLFLVGFAQLFFCLRNPLAYYKAVRVLLSEDSREAWIWSRNFKYFAAAGYLAWELRDEKVDHLHAPFTWYDASLACFVSIFLNIPFSMTVHNEIFIERLLLPAKLDRARFVACISEYSRQTLIKDYPEIPVRAKSSIVRCGINPAAFDGSKPVRHEPPCILSASQLVERKGTAYLIEACSILKRRDMRFHCLLAGDGDERPRLEAMVSKLGLSEEITFSGKYVQAEIGTIYGRADIFVLPCITSASGDRDGIPVVLMEAMAAGVAVISTNVSGIPELIQSEQDGLLVEEKDAEALADAIERLLSDEALTRRLRSAARKKIEAEFSSEISAQRLAALFTEMKC